MEVESGGGIISLGWGSWKVRLSSAWPLFRDLRRNTADLPCRQKLVTWESWCWTKLWAVADQACPGPGILQESSSLCTGGAATAGAVALAPVPGTAPFLVSRPL